MADLSISITNAINAFGPAPSTKWGTGSPYTMTWGTSKWGEGTEDLPISIEKGLSNSVTPDSAVSKEALHALSESIASTFEGESETLTDGSGYSYVFPDNVTNADDRSTPSYTSGTAASTTYTSGTVTSTVWS